MFLDKRISKNFERPKQKGLTRRIKKENCSVSKVWTILHSRCKTLATVLVVKP